MKTIKGALNLTMPGLPSFNRTPAQRLQFFRVLGALKAGQNWRSARECMSEPEAPLSPGMNSKDYGVRTDYTPVMVAWREQMPRGEQWADECEEAGRTVEHSGWYSDADCSRTLRAFVYRLPHGRWGCGYADSDSGQRVYLLEVHHDAKSAAASADHEAKYYAEQEKEYNERWHEARELREKIDEAKTELHRAYALRNVTGKEFDGTPIKEHFRNEAHELARVIRQRMEDLRDNYSDVDE